MRSHKLSRVLVARMINGKENSMRRIKSLPKEKIDEIAALIGESFWDFPYEEGEGGLKPFFPSKQAMSDYMRTFVVAGIESGTFYTCGRQLRYPLGERADDLF